jgi:hypothetical protein
MAYVKQHSILCFVTLCSILVDNLDHVVRTAIYFILAGSGDCLVAHHPLSRHRTTSHDSYTQRETKSLNICKHIIDINIHLLVLELHDNGTTR